MPLNDTVLKDFGGGWNNSDSDKKLNPRFQPVSINLQYGTDGSFGPRFGYEFFGDFYDGVSTDEGSVDLTFTTTTGGRIDITHTAHGYSTGDHVTFSGVGVSVGEHTAEQLNRTHGIIVIDANTYRIFVRTNNTTIVTPVISTNVVHDTHTLSGKTIFGRYFNDKIYVFAQNGEIGTVDDSGAVARVWSYEIADGLSIEPWSHAEQISAEIVRGKLIAVNGRSNDKPLDINTTNIIYLVDAVSGTNTAIPRADIVIAAGSYILLLNTEHGTTKVEIGAKNTVGTFSREASPADAVEIDVGMVTQTTDSNIYGAGYVRGQAFIAYFDRSILMQLGIYNGAVHEPDFDDAVASFGAFSRSAIQELGTDLFCAGVNGVNSLTLAKLSDTIVPTTLSELIDPELLRHIGRLSQDDLRYNTFSVFDPVQHTYILHLPKYTETTVSLDDNPIIVTTDLQERSLAYVNWRQHGMDEGDYVTIAGAVDSTSGITGAAFNGQRQIIGIVDKDNIIVQGDAYPANLNEAMGGTSVTITPVNDGKHSYVYETQSKLRIARWTKYEDLDFDWGTRSQFNRIFYGKNGKVYRMGNSSFPIYADGLYDYDTRVWATSTAYTLNQIVYDSSVSKSYKCIEAHTSSASGSFEDDRTTNADKWEEYLGEAINWQLETPWADFDLRLQEKDIEYVAFDADGTDSFTFGVYTNNVSVDPLTRERLVNRELEYTGKDAGMYGQGYGDYGGGRNTSIEALINFPVTAKLFKFRLSGASTNPLTISSVTLYYHQGQGLI